MNRAARDPNTDLIRALAIALVLVHHVVQSLSGVPESVRAYSMLGAYGVDLFFVLSGWLVGGLYWREQASLGSVSIRRFWGRRWLRTVPPYVAALVLSFAAVAVARGERFDWHYLLFAQNYLPQLPFFLVSWSLCVEEHFYLALPLVLGAAAAVNLRLAFLAAIAVIVAATARLIDPGAVPGAPFGYAQTATHLHLEGLVMGVALARMSVNLPGSFAHLRSVARALLLPLCIGFATIPLWTAAATYYWGNTYVSVLCAAVVAGFAGARAIPVAASVPVRNLALWSYSIYLTHALVLHVVALPALHLPQAVATVLALGAIAAAGWGMHVCVEQPSMRLRDAWLPSRTATPAEVQPNLVELAGIEPASASLPRADLHA